MIDSINTKKGFTLIELLIVIGILGILAAVVVVVLNPGQLLAQARDAQRLQDLGSVNSALSFYLVSTTTPTFDAEGPFSTAHTNCPDGGAAACTVRAVYTTAGSGWVAVNFDSLSDGSPLSALPRDPVNSETYQYVWEGQNSTDTWELVANMESTRYANGGSDDKESTDGGDSTTNFEIGTEPGLDLI